MKISLRIIALMITLSFLLNSCQENSGNKGKIKVEEKSSIQSFDWLLGSWKRNNEEKGKETFEIWKRNSKSEYVGIGFTMQNNDTLKQENIRLIKSNNKWTLEVKTQDEPTPTLFPVTSYSEKEFVCENKELDFPKLIKYWKNGDKINALVSGDEMEISFEFERIKNN